MVARRPSDSSGNMLFAVLLTDCVRDRVALRGAGCGAIEHCVWPQCRGWVIELLRIEVHMAETSPGLRVFRCIKMPCSGLLWSVHQPVNESGTNLLPQEGSSSVRSSTRTLDVGRAHVLVLCAPPCYSFRQRKLGNILQCAHVVWSVHSAQLHTYSIVEQAFSTSLQAYLANAMLTGTTTKAGCVVSSAATALPILC